MLDPDKGARTKLRQLKIDGLCASYSDGRGVWDISETACEGTITAIIGPNGSGKSTLLRALSGIMAFSGSLYLDGRDISAISRSDMAKTISFVDQAHHMGYPFSVLEVLRMGRLPYGRGEPYGQDSMDRAIKVSNSMDLTDLLDRPVTKLSGGEIQRVAVARALVQDCPVMLLDEPTSAMDPGHGLGVFRLLQSASQSGKTLLVTVHDVNLAVAFADRIWAMKAGKIIEQGSPKEVVDGELLYELYGVDFYRYEDEKGGVRWFFR